MTGENEGQASGPEITRRYLDVRELSEYLGISKWMIYKLIYVRGIPFIPFGRVIRFDRVAIDRWAEKRTIFTAPDRRAQRRDAREPFRGLNRSSFGGSDAGLPPARPS